MKLWGRREQDFSWRRVSDFRNSRGQRSLKWLNLMQGALPTPDGWIQFRWICDLKTAICLRICCSSARNMILINKHLRDAAAMYTSRLKVKGELIRLGNIFIFCILCGNRWATFATVRHFGLTHRDNHRKSEVKHHYELGGNAVWELLSHLARSSHISIHETNSSPDSKTSIFLHETEGKHKKNSYILKPFKHYCVFRRCREGIYFGTGLSHKCCVTFLLRAYSGTACALKFCYKA